MSAQHFLRVEHPRLGAIPAFNRDAAALARATRARLAFQARLVDTFRASLQGDGAEPSDSALRTFAGLAEEEHRLEQRLAETADPRATGPTAPSGDGYGGRFEYTDPAPLVASARAKGVSPTFALELSPLCIAFCVVMNMAALTLLFYKLW